MLIIKYVNYLGFLLAFISPTNNLPQINSHNDYFFHKNLVINKTKDNKTSQLFNFKKLLKLNLHLISVDQLQVKKIDSLKVTAKPIFESSDKITFEYNDYDQISTYYRYSLFNEEWNLSDKTMFFYNSNNLLTNRIYRNWNDGFWTNDLQQIYDYDEKGNEIQRLSQNWIDSSWINAFRTTSNYDSLQFLSSSLTERWEVRYWQNNSKIEYKYNETMQIDSVRFYENSSYSWQKVFLTIYNYDDFGKLEYLVSQKWNGNEWENNIKLQIDTLKYGQQINETFYLWDNNQWIKSGRVIYFYDNDKYLHHAHCEYWYNETWVPNIDGIDVYNPDGFEIHYFTHELNIYYEQPTSVEDEKSNLIIDEFELYQNYPNPFNPSTVIKYSIPNNKVIAFRQPTEKQSAEITSVNSFPRNDNMNVKLVVYDILGREITTLVNEEKKTGTYEVIFDAKDLPSGLYFYRLQSGEFIKTKKMLLLK